MTVRPPQSITFVAGPRCRRISSLRPTALIFPSLIATDSTNDGDAIRRDLGIMDNAVGLHSMLLFHLSRKWNANTISVAPVLRRLTTTRRKCA